MSNTATACGKIILSGEYAVVFGYPGIAVPAPFTVIATWEPCHSDTLSLTHSGIENEDYLHRILNEIQKYTGNLHGHLTIENTIPIGRGMGSSTALVIAVTRCLMQSCHPEKNFSHHDMLKNIATTIEGTLNPSHSGLDFEVIWKEYPILFRKGKPPKPISVTINQLIGTPQEFSLIDTGKPDQTTLELVAWVKERINVPSPTGGGSGRGGRERILSALQTIGHCTERLLSGESPLTVFPDHHRAQVALGVVPKKVQILIEEIEKTGGVAKVIGAGGATWAATRPLRGGKTGGGGIVLALAKNVSTLAASYGYHCLNTQHRVH